MESPEVALSEPATKTHKKRPGFATTYGQEFELKLAALLYLRGLNSGLQFELATNVAGAGALDDVVFRFQPSGEADNWTTLFVQLKHKENKGVSRSMLTNALGDFSLRKYFESYLDIKKVMTEEVEEPFFDGSFEKIVCVIFTNAKAGGSLGEECYGPLCQAEDFVWCGRGNIFSFNGDEEILNSLGDDDQRSTSEGDDRNLFLGSLRLFCGQPQVNKLEAAIEKEIRVVVDKMIQGVDCKSVTDCFLRRMKVWYEKSNKVLDKNSDLLWSSVLEINRKEYSLNLNFKDDALSVVRDGFKSLVQSSHLNESETIPNRLICVESSENSCRLSVTKWLQAFEEGCLLILICANGWNSGDSQAYLNSLKDLLPYTNLIVFLPNGGSTAGSELLKEFGDICKNLKDEFSFTQLQENTQNEILAKNVNFQGHKTKLTNLFDSEQTLDASSVIEIMGSDDRELSVGPTLNEGICYYVNRSLDQTFAVDANMFKEGGHQGGVTIQVVDSGAPASVQTLVEKVLNFLSLLAQSSTSIANQERKEVIKNLSKSVLEPDKARRTVFIGPKVNLDVYECRCVGLRFGQSDHVTALQVQLNNVSSKKPWLLFVPSEINENDSVELSNYHQSRHLLSLRGGQLRWVNSFGDIQSIRPYIDKEQVLKISPKNATEVDDRLVLVCAEPGMGKTTLMVWLAKTTKDALPNHFVILIVLNDQSKLFAEGKHNDALEFLSGAAEIESPLQKTMFKYALQVSGRVVILIDGYDEISPMYGNECCTLLSKFFLTTKARNIWMTSRNSFKRELEDAVQKFATRLCKFEEKDQKIFFKMIWKKKSVLKEDELENFIESLLEKTSKAIRDKDRSFMGIPLQTQMLAEVYEDHVTGSAVKSELPENLDLLVLLEKFVDKKFCVFARDKFNFPPQNSNYELLLNDLIKPVYIGSHAKAALLLFVGSDDLKSLGMDSIVKKLKDSFIVKLLRQDKSGFIIEFADEKPRFIHRVFAEYFAASWIAKNFRGKAKQLIKSKMFTVDFAVIRNIFDRILARNCVLHTAVLNEDLEEVRNLLKTDIDVQARDDGDRMALHLAASLGTRENQDENVKRKEILELLIGKSKRSHFDELDGVFEGSPLRYAQLAGWWHAIEKLLGHAENKDQLVLSSDDVKNEDMLEIILEEDFINLLEFCLDKGLEVEHCSVGSSRLLVRACEKNSLKVAELLIAKQAQIINRDGDAAAEVDTPLNIAAGKGHLPIVKLLVQTYESQPGNNVTSFINFREKDGNTAMHTSALNGHANVISFLIDKGGDPKVLNDRNFSLLHYAVQSKQPSVVKTLLDAVDKADLASWTNLSAHYGTCALHYGFQMSNLDCVKLLCEAGAEVTKANNGGETLLIMAAKIGNQQLIEYLVRNFNTEKERIQIDRYINTVDRDCMSAMHWAGWYGFTDIVSLLVTLGGNTYLRNKEDRTPLHLSAWYKHPSTVKVLIDAVDMAYRAFFVNKGDKNGLSVLHTAALGGCDECVELVVQAGGRLSQVNSLLKTPLMLAIVEDNHTTVEVLLKAFDPAREGMTLKEYLDMKDKRGKTAVELAAWKPNCLKVILSFIATL